MKSSKACKREIKSVMNTAGNVSILYNAVFIHYFILFLAPYGFLGTFSFKKAFIFSSPHEQLHLYGLIKDDLKSDASS